jgi:hypothetical protein
MQRRVRTTRQRVLFQLCHQNGRDNWIADPLVKVGPKRGFVSGVRRGVCRRSARAGLGVRILSLTGAHLVSSQEG